MKTISKCLKKQAVIGLCQGSQAIKGKKQKLKGAGYLFQLNTYFQFMSPFQEAASNW